MYFKRVYDPGLAQASFLIGCQQQGSALVIDPRRDIQVYLDLAAQEGLDIVGVAETHIHADYLSGSLDLARRTGAALYLSDEGGPAWAYGVAHVGLRDGSVIELGHISVRALHTPGHTPEHLTFIVSDGARSPEPMLALTGDFIFVGDLGRPDLLDAVAGGADTRFGGARQLFQSLQRLLDLPDYLQLWPGHGSGSACGKALGAASSSTLGYERRTAWWAPYLLGADLAGFTAELLDGQPDAPAYFGRMKRQNKLGPAPVPVQPLLERSPEALGGALLIDPRPREAYQAGSLPNAISLADGRTFETWAGWLLDPETEPRPLVLLAPDAATAQALRARLWRVGVDQVTGYVTALPAGLTAYPTISPAALQALPDPFVLDVRTQTEFDAGHIPGATRIHAGQLPQRLGELPRDRAIVVHCQSGQRSPGASSLLRAHGFGQVLELDGGYPNWARWQADRGSMGSEG